jgi:hypothetical protein
VIEMRAAIACNPPKSPAIRGEAPRSEPSHFLDEAPFTSSANWDRGALRVPTPLDPAPHNLSTTMHAGAISLSTSR